MASKYPSIPRRVLVFIAWHNLTHKKLRAFLTIFGIVIGIGAIFLLLSFGIGLQRLVIGQVIGDQSIKTMDVTSPNAGIVGLNNELFQKMKNLPHVKRIGASFSFAGQIKSRGGAVDAVVYGVDDNYLSMSNLTLESGRLLRHTDEKSVLINRSTMRSIGVKTPSAVVGKEINLAIPALSGIKTPGQQKFQVVGVTNDEGGSEVYIPSGIFVANGVKNFTQIKVEADSSSDVRDLRTQISTLGLQSVSPIDTVDQINQVFKFFNVILVGFGAVGMVVAVLGMFNTLTISLLERTKEIGLMIALGGRNRDMRKLFVFEAVLLSLVGAIIGIIGAIILGQTINLALNLFAKHRGVTEGFQLFAVPWWLILSTITFMVVVGLLVVIIPARRAARINAIDALRRE